MEKKRRLKFDLCLTDKEPNQVFAGRKTVPLTPIEPLIPLCHCACAYAGQGGSSTADNRAANDARGLWS